MEPTSAGQIRYSLVYLILNPCYNVFYPLEGLLLTVTSEIVHLHVYEVEFLLTLFK